MNIWTGLLLNQGHVANEQLARDLADAKQEAKPATPVASSCTLQCDVRDRLGLTGSVVRLGFR